MLRRPRGAGRGGADAAASLRAAEEADALAEDGDPADVPGLLLAGKTPGRLIEELTDALGPPAHPLDWKTALRMFVARSARRCTRVARPNRRFPGRVGEVPGRTYAAPRAITKPSVLVAIDTSMSMRREELSEIARQLQVMSESARITVVECDVEIGRVYAFDGRLDEVGRPRRDRSAAGVRPGVPGGAEGLRRDLFHGRRGAHAPGAAAAAGALDPDEAAGFRVPVGRACVACEEASAAVM